MNANEYLLRLITAAEDQGWMVLRTESESPGYIVLGDMDGTEIRIDTKHGIGTEAYIRQLTPLRWASKTVPA